MHLSARFAVVLTVLVVPSAAQGLWTIDAAGNTAQHNGPSALPCGAPLGPLLALWNYDVPGPCATPGPIGAGTFQGDVGMNRAEDLLWITDGSIAAAYQTFGTPVTSGIDVTGLLGGPITGLDWDPAIGGIWVTDGQSAASAVITADALCFKATLASSFALPIAHQATALAHDPVTNALWVVDDGGFLTHVTKSGALGSFGSKNVTGFGCALSTALTGVAADTAGPAGRVYVTDGAKVAAINALAPGGLAGPTFYSPVSCYASPVGAIQGLVVAATGNSFGAASGGFFPGIGHKGQSIVPNPTFAIEVGGAHEGEIAVLVLGNGYLCPAATVLGVPFHISPTPLVVVATKVIDATGFASIPVPLGSGTPIGHTVFLQWGLISPLTLAASSSRGMALTTSLP